MLRCVRHAAVVSMQLAGIILEAVGSCSHKTMHYAVLLGESLLLDSAVCGCTLQRYLMLEMLWWCLCLHQGFPSTHFHNYSLAPCSKLTGTLAQVLFLQ